MDLIELLQNPWPWYVAGPLIGLTVPALLLVGNKAFGISSALRHICAAVVPAKIPFFQYNWRAGIWNLFFVAGILIGGFIAGNFLSNPNDMVIAEATRTDLQQLGLHDFSGLLPAELFSVESIFSLRGLFFLVWGSFLVGFGTRYAGGCTSGHSIMGLSNLQWPSLVATICFMIGGFLGTHLLLPILLSI
jgi:uncharacterized membrane protein YedE/YeeE